MWCGELAQEGGCRQFCPKFPISSESVGSGGGDPEGSQHASQGHVHPGTLNPLPQETPGQAGLKFHLPVLGTRWPCEVGTDAVTLSSETW